MPADRDALAKLTAAQVRWCLIFLALAIAVPLGLHALFERQARRLDALASDGAAAEATVTAVETRDAKQYTAYEYTVAGTKHTWNVAHGEAPYATGEHFTVLYLPAHPELSRATTDRARIRAEAADNRSFTLKLIIGVFAFFACNALLSAHKFRKLLDANPGSDATLISPAWLGRLVALIILGIVLAVINGDDKVAHAAFGERLLGLPVGAGLSLVVTIIYLPFFAFFQHLMLIILQANRDNVSTSKLRLAMYIAQVHRRHPELALSRRVVIGGTVYFVLVVAGWIAYAAARGI
ncbi:MAG TPA: hypothetical protein VHB97_16495 [Polyangia bacterium]|nr:hypothetical protein [Polyangia bacterium]